MFLTETKSKIKAIRPGDEDFILIDGLTLTSRAGFEIDKTCPYEYKLIITECINKGWLKPIAYRPVHEEFLEEITK